MAAVRAMVPFALCAIAFHPTSAPAAAIGAEASIDKYCEPLISGSSAAAVALIARNDGFKDELVGGQPALRMGRLLVALSETPRACFVQAPSEMTFENRPRMPARPSIDNRFSLVSPRTIGPDGARVKAWSSPSKGRTILVTEQTNPQRQKVIAFILMRLPSGTTN